jgi:hypothetical protein
MYGTIGLCRIKPGMESQFKQLIEGQASAFESGQVPGFVASYSYRMDADSNEYYLAVLFDSKETYWANAQNPKQDTRYRQWLPLLEGEPEWHDGEIVVVFVRQNPS